MAWNLAEFSKIEKDTLRGTVIDGFLVESNIAQLIPWETINALTTGVIRLGSLPSVGFRNINGSFSESTGTVFQEQETIALSGLDIDTDKAIARAKNTVADARALQQQLALKAYAYAFNDKFLNGNPGAGGTSSKEFRGIIKRIDDLYNQGFTDQRIASYDDDVGILYDAAHRQAFLDDLDKLLYAIKGHQADLLLMNHRALLAVRSLLRRDGLLATNKDMFGRNIDMYGSARLVDVGVKADQQTEIITNTETTVGASGGTECTSIYAVKFGIGDMLWGIQEYPMEVSDLGELQTAPIYRTRIEWNIGLANVDPRCMARLYGVVPDASS
mgnify:CR=1 FL=1